MSNQPVVKKKRSLSRTLSCIGNVSIAMMMLLTTADVVGRLFFQSPVVGAYEITEYLMLITVFSFLAYTQAEKAHIGVDFIFDRLPQSLQTLLNRFDHAICFAMMAIVTWMAFYRIFDLIRTEEKSALLSLPDYPFAIFMVVGFIAICIEFFKDIFGTKSVDKEKTAQ